MPKQIKDVIQRQIKGIWGNEPMGTVVDTAVIKTNNMSYDGSISFDSLTYRYFNGMNLAEHYLQSGDLLVEKSGGTKTHPVGYVAYFENDNRKVVCNNFILALRPDHTQIVSRYLFYQIRYKYENGFFTNCYNKTTGIQNLQVSNYLSTPIVCPEISTQRNQSNELDRIEHNIRLKKNELKTLDELIKSRFIEMFGEPEINPNNYPKTKIKEIAECVAGATPSTSIKEYWDNGTIPWMSSGEVHNGRIYDTEKKITKLGYANASTNLIPPHTVVMAMAGQGKTRGTVGVAEIELCTNQSLCSIITSKALNTDFLYYLLKLQYNELRSISNGDGGRGGLNLTIIGNYKIYVPPITLQNEFAEFVKLIDKSKFVDYSKYFR